MDRRTFPGDALRVVGAALLAPLAAGRVMAGSSIETSFLVALTMQRKLIRIFFKKDSKNLYMSDYICFKGA